MPSSLAPHGEMKEFISMDLLPLHHLRMLSVMCVYALGI